MQLLIVRGDLALNLPETSYTEKDLAAYKKIRNIASRGPIYGFPILFFIWIGLAWPDIFPEEKKYWLLEVAIYLFTLVFIPIIHEMLHLAAIPSKLFHPETLVTFRMDGLRSGFSSKVGGVVMRNGYVWISLFPTLILTVCPFLLLAYGWKLPLWIGFAASLNFGLSIMDLIQAAVAMNKTSRTEIIQK